MKTPFEIKNGLEICPKGLCEACPYPYSRNCQDALVIDALAYIKQLEADNNQKDARVRQIKRNIRNALREKNAAQDELAAVKRERDAAVKDLRITFNCCDFCEHSKDGILCKSKPRIDHSCFEWRGVCPENTEVQ